MPDQTAADAAWNATLAAGGYSDACGGAVTAELVSAVISPTSTNCNWTVTYNFKVKDACGNYLNGQSYTRSGSDQTPPSFSSCPTNVTKSANQGDCFYTATGSEFDAVASDICSSVLYKYVLSGDTPDPSISYGTNVTLAGKNFNVGTTTVTWYAKDDCGNENSTCSFDVKVNPIPVCVTYTGDLFANTSKTNKGVEIPAEIVVSISIPVSEMSCGAIASLVSFTLVADDANVKPASIGSVTRVTENEFYVFSQKYSVLLGKLLSTSITITWNIGGDYIINKDCDTESLVTVSAPANDFVTGGGYIVLSEAVNGGSYIGDVGTKNNFGFNIKWAKNFTRLTGNINTIWRTDDGRRYQAKSNSAGSLVVYKKLDTDGKLIGYQANIIYTNVNIRLLGGSTNAFGNGKIIMTIYEWGEPGSNLAQKQPDEIGFVIFDSKGNIVHATNVYNNTDGLKPVDVQYLDAGNIQVHANPTNLENKSAEIATGIVPDIDFADLKVYPNPFSEKLRFEFVSPVSCNARIDLYDMTGRMVKTIFEQPIEGGVSYEAEFRPETIISGMYFYRVKMGEAIYNGKVVFKKE